MGENLTEILYQIDANDRLTSVSDNWVAFARANGAESLQPEAVLGQRLWAFISDVHTRHFHQVLLSRARGGQTLRHLPYRCDSPDRHRVMEMDIDAAEDGSVTYRSRVIAIEHSPWNTLMTPTRTTTEPSVRMCSWCKRVEMADGCWLPPEDAVAQLRLFDTPTAPTTTHTICSKCFKHQIGNGHVPSQ